MAEKVLINIKTQPLTRMKIEYQVG